MVDGSAESLGRVRDEVAEKAEEEVNAVAMEANISPAEALRALCEALGAQAKRQWPVGGVPGLHEAPFLLAFVRQLQAQGRAISESVPLSCPEETRGRLRMLWIDIAFAGAPRERGLDGQLTGEHSDALHLLSSLLARHVAEAWREAHAAYAEVGFPLGHNSINRVGRLRGYGNALNAEAATAFVQEVISVVAT
jgi:hypothetical protein